MAANVQRIGGVQPIRVEPTFLTKVYLVAEMITQFAVRAFFIISSVLMTAATFPLSWHAAVIPAVAFGTTILAAFFYPQMNLSSGPLFGPLPPLLNPLLEDADLPPHFPVDAPRGFIRGATQNCAFISMAQVIDSDPELARFIRNPVTDQTLLPDFLNFLAEYHPPARLIADFQEYIAAQPHPQLPVPNMFEEFLNGYVPRLEERVEFGRIQECYRQIRVLHGPFSEFFRIKDEAVRDRRAVARGDVQELRLALNRVTPVVEPSPYVQMDVCEALEPFLTALPDRFRVRVETTYHFNQGIHPMLALPVPIVEPTGIFSLPIVGDDLTLDGLWREYTNSTNHEPQRRMDVTGVARNYLVERATIAILDRPESLRFQIKRFIHEKQVVSWWSYLFPRIFPPIPFRSRKLDHPIEFPDHFNVTLKNGAVCRTALSSFMIHHGGSIHGGHYTSGRILNGQKYLINDDHVTLVTPENQRLWDEHLQQAYFVCYTPVAEPAPAV